MPRRDIDDLCGIEKRCYEFCSSNRAVRQQFISHKREREKERKFERVDLDVEQRLVSFSGTDHG